MGSFVLHYNCFNSTTMWPGRLDLSRDECKKCLRYLELEAYGNMVSVLRAQGSFTNEKQKLLQELAKALHISNERHRAEVRRAVNDEKLSIIAEQLSGPNTGTDWAIEGRRTIPLLPRLNARTAFTSLANSLSLATSVANAKNASTSEAEVADVKVKVETEPAIEKAVENESPANITCAQPEGHSIGRKRRRSRVELQDIPNSMNQFDDASNIVRDVFTSFSCTGPESLSPVPVSLSNKVFIMSTSTASEVSQNNFMDNVAEVHSVNSSSSIASTTSHQTITSQNTSFIQVTAQVNRSFSTVVPAFVTATAPSKMRAKVISTQSKVQPTTTPIVIPTSCSQHAVAKSIQSELFNIQTTSEGDESPKLVQLTSYGQKAVRPSSSTSSTCMRRITTTTNSSTRSTVGVKPVLSQSGPRMVTVSTAVASSGPGPPHIRPTAAVLTCKKMPAIKTGHQAAKMGITLNSGKTLNIASNPGSRVATKANVIVVQKGPARGVTLSHAGKEVLGKVIMGGKNLCLSNPQSANTVSLLPHRIPANGEQSLAMLSPINSSQPESVKINTKSGNMIVFDLRQDSLEKSKVLSEILEASGVFNSESKTAILNTNSHLLLKEQKKDAQTPTCPVNKSSHAKSATISFVMDSKEHRTNKETIVELPPESKTEGSEETLVNPDCIGELQGTLDPQTGIYSFQTPENTINSTQADEAVSGSGINIFSTALASAEINLESFQYIDDGDSNNALDDVRNQILTIDQLNDAYDSQQSISDKSNC